MRSALTMAAALDPLGKPPDECRPYAATVTAKGASPQLDDNNLYGTCVPASTANALILRTANTLPKPVVPTIQEVLDLYHVVGGFVLGDPSTDNGVDETNMCEFLVRTGGFLGHQSDATGMIDPRNQDHIKWCNILFGSCRVGWNLPGYAQDQFKAGKPWDVQTGGDQKISGHDAPIVDFRGGMYFVISWGKLHPVTPAALAAWAEESHAELFFDWTQAQGQAPSGFDLTELAQKLPAVTVAGGS
jgi:hypothetical protein